MDSKEFRVVLIGKTGVGKSAAGNTILGHKAFKSEFAPESVTINCKKDRGVVGGRKVSVVDTAGLYDTRFSNEKVVHEIKQCMCFAAPGPHVFLVVIRLVRFTEEEQKTVEIIQEVFGPMSNEYTIILFTGGDELKLKGVTIENYLKASSKLQELIRKCDDRYHVFNNKSEDPSQVTELLGKIKSLVDLNGSTHYTTEMLQLAERAIEEQKHRNLKDTEHERHKEMEKLKRRYVGPELTQEQTRLKAKQEEDARRKAETNNSFLSNFKQGVVIAAKAVLAIAVPVANVVQKCSIQ